LLFIENKQSQTEAVDNELPEALRQQTLIDPPGRGQIQDPLRLSFHQHSAVHFVLAHRLLQVAHGGRTQEALDLDGDPLVILLGGYR